MSQRSQEFFSSVRELCLPRIYRATVPILGVQDDQIKHDRTGVLYRIAGEHFILTAAHDLRGIVEHNIGLYVSVNAPGILPFPLAEARFHSTEEVGRDVAAIWLPPDLAQEIGKHKDFLSHNQIDMNGIKRRVPYVFFGYPMDWSGHMIAEDHVYSRAMAFTTFEHVGERCPEESFFDPNVHFALNFTREAINFQAQASEKLPKLFGISGCGIWRVGDRGPGALEPRSPDNLTLVGIQHRWFPSHNYIQATRVGYVLEMINQYFPETRVPMSLVYPAA
jgi:hypothetical protein